MINIVGRKKIWFTFSGILIGLAAVAIVLFSFRESAEFKGGSLWEFSAPADHPALTDVQDTFTHTLGLQNAAISMDGANRTFTAHFDTIDEPTHQKLLGEFKTKWPSFTELNFYFTSPSVAADLREKALIAVTLVIVGISLYIAFAFRKASRPVSSWKYGWITLLTLFHDVAIPAGLLAVLGRFRGIEVDSNSVVALLVVMGFSVHDTIVVFDRIRENLLTHRGKAPFATVVNDSVNQTLARSINTSLTLILVLVALYFVGPANLEYFILTLLVGVTTGIYSSIFIASPALVLLKPKNEP